VYLEVGSGSFISALQFDPVLFSLLYSVTCLVYLSRNLSLLGSLFTETNTI